MKSRIVAKCSCGKEWSDDNTPEAAESWWKVLDIADPKLAAEIEKKGDKKTVELALRLVWARHSLYRKEKGDKIPHEATITEHITIETIEEVKMMQKPESDTGNLQSERR
jgi:hypothetical protein